jgi:hemerythrin-like domain-containing protein
METDLKEFVPPTEDLMQEHGLLNRLLLIYEAVIKYLTVHHTIPHHALEQAVHLMKVFVEDYHEKMEEDYIFPLFEKHKKQVRLVKTLRNQHLKGRAITAQIQTILAQKEYHKTSVLRTLKPLLQRFITMYRPHESREDTVLFPLVRSLITEQEFKVIGELFEDSEHALFGPHGFKSLVHKVERIEKELGIYQLEQFTPY